MTTRDDALQALEDRDWSGAQVEQEPRPASVVHGVRLSPEKSDRLVAEATRRGITPSALLREIVDKALDDERAEDDLVVLRRADLLRAIDTIAQRAA